jgi:hypothetical protein
MPLSDLQDLIIPSANSLKFKDLTFMCFHLTPWFSNFLLRSEVLYSHWQISNTIIGDYCFPLKDQSFDSKNLIFLFQLVWAVDPNPSSGVSFNWVLSQHHLLVTSIVN